MSSSLSFLHVLGAGTPTPTETRFGTSSVLQLGEKQIMIDCGPSAVFKMVKLGLWPTGIDHLFLTHHHFDHIAGYPCFLIVRFEQGLRRENPLKVFGPVHTKRLTSQLIGEGGFFEQDISARCNMHDSLAIYESRGGALPRPKPRVHAEDLSDGDIVETLSWRATTARVEHQQPWMESLAYRFDYGDGSIAFTGDAVTSEKLLKLINGVKTLVVNCWDRQEELDDLVENASIAGTTMAAEMAAKSGAEKLILTHISKNFDRQDARKRGLADIREYYDGETVFADELTSISL
jgi:ribonuclease BN (tRNA processing enzyme)